MTAWLSGGMLIAGATLALLASIGVLRMPDVFTRMQASTKASTLGLGFLLIGLAIRNPEFAFVVRAVSIAAFGMSFLTGDPTEVILGDGADRMSIEEIQAFRVRMGFDRPWYV